MIDEKNKKISMAMIVVLEILIITIMGLIFFNADVRNNITGKKVSSREDAAKKGYGVYSDPERGKCISLSGDCNTPGTRTIITRCIPNLENGNGCMTPEGGLMTYDMIIEEEPCQQQCFSSDLSLNNGIGITALEKTEDEPPQKNIITSVGTHNIINTNSGQDFSDYFLGNFDQKTLSYPVKNCIPDRSNFRGYKVLEYRCDAGTNSGVDGCRYTCGSDDSLNFTDGILVNNGNISGKFDFPVQDDKFVCYGVQENNLVEILNSEKTVPDDFIFPQKCYQHPNVFVTDKISIQKISGFNFTRDDPYLYLESDTSDFNDFLNPDYNLLNNPFEYIKLDVLSETRLLSRIFKSTGGITKINGLSLAYIPVKKSSLPDFFKPGEYGGEVFLKPVDVASVDTLYPADLVYEYEGKSLTVEELDYWMIPFKISGDGGLFKDSEIKTGHYIYDSFSNTVVIHSDEFVVDDYPHVCAYLKFDDDPYLSVFQKIEILPVKKTREFVLSGDRSEFPKKSTGKVRFGTIKLKDETQESYLIVLPGNSEYYFTISSPTIMPIPGTIAPKTFSGSRRGFSKIYKSVDETVPFYIYGTGEDGFPGEGQTGFFYPLYLSQAIPPIEYHKHMFLEYPGKTFYMPKNNNNHAKNFVEGNLKSYDYYRGISIIESGVSGISLEDDKILTFNYNPRVITPGNGYDINTIYETSEGSNIVVSEIIYSFLTLETARNGDAVYNFTPLKQIVSDSVLRKSLDKKDYTITFSPQKLLDVVRDFTLFKGPYIERNNKKDFVCCSDTGNPLPMGTEISFSIGETLVVNVPDDDFNSKSDVYCGSVLDSQGRQCLTKRNPQNFEISEKCISFNPGEDYYPLEGFFEKGFILEEKNKLFCFDETGKKIDDSGCNKPFLTDYLDDSKIYDTNEELIINKEKILTYLSLLDNNTDLPETSNWIEVSNFYQIFFNPGQYLLYPNVFETSTSGVFYEDPNNFLTYLGQYYRKGSDIQKTKIFYGDPLYEKFKTNFNPSIPWTLKDITESQNIKYRLLSSPDNLTNPVLKVVASFEKQNYLEENFINGLVWFLSSKNFLSISTFDYPTTRVINFFTVDDQNKIENMKGSSDTTIVLSGTDQEDLTGYYCYLVPFIALNAFKNDQNTDALFPYQWVKYIENLGQGTKFEIVFVKSFEKQPSTIIIERNITKISDGEIFKIIEKPPDGDASVGYLLPFSKNGPFRNPIENLSFDFPERYGPFSEDITSGQNGFVEIYGKDKKESFFDYGFAGFAFPENHQTPNFTREGKTMVVKQNQNLVSFIREIYVPDDFTGAFYFSGVGDKNFRQGDTVVYTGPGEKTYEFTIVGLNSVIEQNGYYRTFDYKAITSDSDFFENYTRSDLDGRVLFLEYVRYENTRVLPGFYIDSGNVPRLYSKKRYDIETGDTEIFLDGGWETVYPEKLLFLTSLLDYSVDLDQLDSLRKYLYLLNENKADRVSLSRISLNDGTFVVDNIVPGGTPQGMITGNSGDYQKDVSGKTFFKSFEVGNILSLENGIFYGDERFIFYLVDKDIASCNFKVKTHGQVPPYFDGSGKTIVYGDIYNYKDYRSKLIYRNNSSSPQKFTDQNVWEKSQSLYPEVNYKFYHPGQVYAAGDLVKFDNFLWKALKNISLSRPLTTRPVPSTSNTDWEVFDPTGDLYSQENFFTAVLGSIDEENFPIETSRIDTFENIPYFSKKEFLFNQTYLFLVENPVIFSTLEDDFPGGLITDKYTFVGDDMLTLEIRYFFDKTEVSKSIFLESFSLAKEKSFSFKVSKSFSSLLSVRETREDIILFYSHDQTTSRGSINFINSYEKVSKDLEISNRLNNQNIPIRVSNYGRLGHCVQNCIKNIDSQIYENKASDYIDFINPDLRDKFFNNEIKSFVTSEKDFISLANEPCRENTSIQERFLTPCFTSSDKPNYSQYLYKIPGLTPGEYGKPFCLPEDFIFSNSLLFYFVPMDIDSQDFLKYTIASEDTLSLNNVNFPDTTSTITIENAIIKNLDEEYLLGGGISINNFDKSYITNGNKFFYDIKNTKSIGLETDSDPPVRLTLIIDKIQPRFFPSLPLNLPGVDNHDLWYIHSEERVICHGYIYKDDSSGECFPVKLSYADLDIDFVNLTMVIKSTTDYSFTLEIPEKGYVIEKFSFIGDATSLSDGPNLFSADEESGFSDLNVSVYKHDGRILKQNERKFTQGTPVLDENFVFYDRQKRFCKCKVYSNYSSYFGLVSYTTTGETVKSLDDKDFMPLVFNESTGSILENKLTPIQIQAGNEIIETEKTSNVFIIDENLHLKPNYYSKPFNSSENSTFYPDIYENDKNILKSFGAIASTTSDNLFTVPIDDFEIVNEKNVKDFYINIIDGKNSIGPTSNDFLRQLEKRNSFIRENYPESTQNCNIVISPTDSIPVGYQYEISTGPGGGISVNSGPGDIEVVTNNTVEFDQSKSSSPVLVSIINNVVLTSRKTPITSDQFLIVSYSLDYINVTQEVFSNAENFDKATRKYVSVVYQTSLTGDTVPVLDEYFLVDSLNLSKIKTVKLSEN